MPDPQTASASGSDPIFGTAPKQHLDIYPAISPDALASSMRGRVVLVTGASRGIGRAIALAYARSGASGLAVLARTASQLASLAAEIGTTCPETKTFVCVADVSDRTALSEALLSVEKELGKIDVLVANAGVNSFRPFAYTPGEEWWKIIEINLKGPMMLAELVLPAMRERNEGALIFISSRAGIVSLGGLTSYTVSKTALLRACACLQIELDTEVGGTSGIHMYALHPGGVKSDMTLDALHPDVEKMQKGFTERMQHFYEANFNHTAELCAQTCVYLATGRASSLRGRYIDVGDDIEDLVRQGETIKKMGLYDLGIKSLGGQWGDGLPNF